jgi:hypothetical protein
MTPTNEILRRLLEWHRKRLPTDERITIETVNEPFLLTSDVLRIRLWRMKGEGLRAIYREWTVDVPQHLFADRYARNRAVDALAEAVSYLVLMLFPRPTPRFRIRRDARWGRA